MSFPSDKAPGIDKIPISVIKDALPCILPFITLIANRSLLSSVFPSVWKTSEVVPLPKDVDHQIANTNRPLSLLPAASKVCEWIVLNQLTSCMNKNNRLPEHQSRNKSNALLWNSQRAYDWWSVRGNALKKNMLHSL